MNKKEEFGSLKIQAFTANHAIPISDVKVEVYQISDKKDELMFEGITNSSGIIDDIKLPANSSDSSNVLEKPVPTYYEIVAKHAKYKTLQSYKVCVYPDIKSIQFIRMHPNGELNE